MPVKLISLPSAGSTVDERITQRLTESVKEGELKYMKFPQVKKNMQH